MRFLKKLKEQGIPLRSANTVMLLITVLVTSLLIYETFQSLGIFSNLSDMTDAYIKMQRCADELMTASDYLTEEVQCFTVTGEKRHMDNYFTEAEVTCRREEALRIMQEEAGDTPAYAQLKEAMDDSIELMQREYYAMRLMADAKNYSSVPPAIAAVELDRKDKTLSPDAKIEYARALVHDQEYYDKKNEIREEMQNCLNALETSTHQSQSQADTAMKHQLRSIRILTIVQTAAIIFVLWLTSYLGIIPLLKGVEKIKENSTLPIMGSYEFRYLARTYNKMYEAFKKSIASLNYEASHDKLTGLYNRAGYDLLQESLDLRSTAALMIDADKFKEINDTYGHDTGDAVLVKIAHTLRSAFRSEDYVCRLGGDEFVVFMLHMDESHAPLIENKVNRINEVLANTSDGIPKISISVGVSFGSQADHVNVMIKHADLALYQMKEAGRAGCTFYHPQINDHPM